MILGKIWKSIAAQFNKLANSIRGYDPIAEMQLEYDRSVEQIKEGREGLAQYRALVERVGRQVTDQDKHVALLEAKVKAYLNAGDRDTAARFALELKRAKDDQAENQKQLALHEQAYQNNLLKIQHAVKKLDEVKHKIHKYDAELKMSRAEAEMAQLCDPVLIQRHDRLRPGRAGPAGPDRQESRQGTRGGRPLGRDWRKSRRKSPSRKPWPRTRLREFEVSKGLATPETTKSTQSTKELGPATKTLAPVPRDRARSHGERRVAVNRRVPGKSRVAPGRRKVSKGFWRDPNLSR